MNKLRILILGFIFTAFCLVPVSAQAQAVSIEEAYRSTLIQLIEVLQKQIANLQAELEQRQSQASENGSEYSFSGSVESVATYEVGNDLSFKNIVVLEHRAYFARVFELLPDEFDIKVDRLMVYKQGELEVDAFVETGSTSEGLWLFAVNEEIVKDSYSDSNTELIVHELAHIISYEEIIGLAKPVNGLCDKYFKKRGCPSENSYLKQFVNKFWTTEDLERAENFSNRNEPLKSAYDYNDLHKTEYVSDYSALSPEEDFSESFRFFILDEFVNKSLAEEKVNFFEEYPELHLIKKEVMKNI